MRYATPLYSTKAKLMIKGVGRSGNLSEASILIEGLGIESGGKDMDNEIQILLSRPLIATTVERIKANITYTQPGSTDEVNNAPVLVESNQLAEDVQIVQYLIKPGADGTFELSTGDDQP